jgi:Tol biopolymer transport system component
VAFATNRSGPNDIYVKSANGVGDAEPLLQSDVIFKNPYSWSPDGKFIAFDQPDPKTGWDVWLLPLDGDRKPVPLLHSTSNEDGGWISPDGHWIAYYSDESGREEVYTQSFPIPGSKYQVSTTGAHNVFWSRDGKEMLIAGKGGTVSTVAVETTPTTFKSGPPRVLFQLPAEAVDYVATPDLSRMLVTVPVGDSPPGAIEVDLNWAARLARAGGR